MQTRALKYNFTAIGILSLCTSAHLTFLSLSNPALNLTFSLLPITSSHPHASASGSTFDFDWHWHWQRHVSLCDKQFCKRSRWRRLQLFYFIANTCNATAVQLSVQVCTNLQRTFYHRGLRALRKKSTLCLKKTLLFYVCDICVRFHPIMLIFDRNIPPENLWNKHVHAQFIISRLVCSYCLFKLLTF